MASLKAILFLPYLSLILKALFPGISGPIACLSFIDDFVLVVNNIALCDNITQLEHAFTLFKEAMAAVGLRFEPNKTELMHFTPKDQHTPRGRKPIRFQTLFPSLPSIQLRSGNGRFPPVFIHPSKEWWYLGFYLNPFLSFSSHVSRYSNKALKVAQNLRIMGHCYGGIDPKLRRQVYYAVCWSVMTYGMPLWYHLHAKGVKNLVNRLTKAQNVAICWITGAFRTTPTFLMEFLSSIAPVHIRLDYQLRNFMVRVSTVPASHPLWLLASLVPVYSPHARAGQRKRPASENIHLLRSLVKDFRPFPLFSLLLRLGYCIIDHYMDRLLISVPPHPKKGTALFDQWLLAWRQDTLTVCNNAHYCIGMDASYKGEHIASAAIVVQFQQLLVYQSNHPCSAHSSFNGELQAILDAVEYIALYLQGRVIIITDNEATIKAAVSNSLHSGFHASLHICKMLHKWFCHSPQNHLQLRWFPGHEGLELNELADSLAGQAFPSVPPLAVPTSASHRQSFKACAVIDWRLQALPLLQAR